MSVALESAIRIKNIIDSTNEKTGIYHSDLTEAVQTLTDRYLPPTSSYLYSFGAISDPHIQYGVLESDSSGNATKWDGVEDLKNALAYLDDKVDFVCVCGDLVAWASSDYMAQYEAIVTDTTLTTKPIYECAGNHETYPASGVSSTIDKTLWETTTGWANHAANGCVGDSLYYYFTHNNDVFIMLSLLTATPYAAFADGALDWLESVLETNKDKRCFVFQHVHDENDDTADPSHSYSNMLNGEEGQRFLSLMKQYRNTVWFHGHTHLAVGFELDSDGIRVEASEYAPTSFKLGYKSVHIPSLQAGRFYNPSTNAIQNTYNFVGTDGKTYTAYGSTMSEGYIVDVYDNKIVVRCIDFVNGTPLANREFAINTAVPALDSDAIDAVADEIRNKTGLTDGIDTEQMAIDIAALPPKRTTIPAYVRTEAERVASVVKSLQNENTVSILCCSDMHTKDPNHYTSAYLDSLLHMAQGVSIVKGLVPLDFTALLGDNVWGATTDTKEMHVDNLMAFVRTSSLVGADAIMNGNHDNCIYVEDINQTPEELQKYFGRFNHPDCVEPSTDAERNYFYYDITDKKVRVICLNTSDLKGFAAGTDDCNVSAEQVSWLVNTLDMTGKSGWSILVLSHHPIHWLWGNVQRVLDVLKAYVSGASGSVTVNGQSVAYNFSGKNAAKLVATFHGHTHNFITGEEEVGDADGNTIIRMGTPEACRGRTNEYALTSYNDTMRTLYGELDSDGNRVTAYEKVGNSAKDTAFCVYTIDLDAKVVYATAYGAGHDRVMSYGGATYYNVTYALTNVTSDNAVGSVKKGESFTATLSVADNYTINTLTVTMGGVDITASCVTGNKIQISEVTGNIVITAAASGFTNQIPLSINADGSQFVGTNGEDGYKVGYRLSTSSGNESAQAGISVTGFISLPVAPCTVRVKNITFSNSNSTWCTYNSSFTKTSSGYCNTQFADEGNGVLTHTFNTTGYLRISGEFGENPIVTVNEEIT